MVEEWLYASAYWCEDCKKYHSVSAWFEKKGNKTSYYVTDEDGDTVAEFDKYEDMYEEYPAMEMHTILPKYKYEKWFALITPDGKKMKVTSVKKGGRWDKGWRDNAISPTTAPSQVRLMLALPIEDVNYNIIDGLSSWDEVAKAVVEHLPSGKVYKATTVISFMVQFKVEE